MKSPELLLLDEPYRFLDPLVGQILVTESGGMAARVEADAADAVDDGAVVDRRWGAIGETGGKEIGIGAIAIPDVVQ